MRAPHAHASIKKIHVEAAARLPGVARVFTFADLERWMTPLPLFGAPPPGLAAVITFDIRQAPQYALCRDRARHVGEIVAMVVADEPGAGRGRCGTVQVDWEPLPPVVDMRAAAAADSAADSSRVGHQRRRRLHATPSATPTPRLPGPTSR